jgi:nicotinate-nucleotide adenylyltransferase
LRLGVFGGTFDPPHYGHLAAGQEVRHRLALEQVLLVPARQNPLKAAIPGASAEQRVRMLELAVADDSGFAVSRADLDRPAPSYTVDLLAHLERGHPGAELLFLVGADALRDLPAWREPDEIVRRWRLVTFPRAGAPPPSLAELEARLPAVRNRVILCDVPGVAITSRDVRARVAAGAPIRYLVPESVRAHVEREGLYRPSLSGAGGPGA